MTTVADKIAANLRLQKLLGWTCAEIVPGSTTVNASFVDGVVVTQTALGTPPDGVCGSATYRLVLAKRIAELEQYQQHQTSPGTDARLATAGKLAITWARLTWTKNIADNALGEPMIDPMIRTNAGINWHWRPPYRADTFEWCGAFAAFAWYRSIAMKTRQAFFSSTGRLDAWARYEVYTGEPNPRPAVGAYRSYVNLDEHSTHPWVAGFGGTGPRAGDILLVGGVGTGPGKHITLVERYDEAKGIFHTIEGNGGGYGPDGVRRQGVVISQRPLGGKGLLPTAYHARRLIRPAPHDIL